MASTIGPSVDLPGWDVLKRVFGEFHENPLLDLVVGVEGGPAGPVKAALVMVTVPNFTNFGRPWVCVEHVVVSPELRGQGVGRALMDWVIELAKKRNAYKVQLTSGDDSAGFYRSLNFSNEGLVGFKLYLD